MSQNDFHVLIDADVFVGWMFTEDAHHQKAKLALQQARAEYLTPVTTNYVVGEAATVLSKLADQSLAKDFLKVIDSITTIHITPTLHQQSLEIFKQLKKKRSSVIDCSNVAVMRQFNIPKIFSFDKIYTNKFGLQSLHRPGKTR